VTRQETNWIRYSITVLNCAAGILAIVILFTNSMFQQQQFRNILNFQHLEFCIILTMICLSLGSLLVPAGQSISADIAEITNKILEPGSLEHGIEKQISNQIDYIMKALNSHSEITRAFSNSLAEAGRNLVELTSPEQLRLAIGLLVVENNKMYKETNSLQSDLTTAKIQIENLKENLEEAEETGLRDSLTSLWNRRAFDNMLDAEIMTAPNRKLPLCLIMADIDHFKKVNDTFGHTIGDEIIRLVAKTISQNIKGKDIASRYGGEEFAIILPETELVNAINIAEQVRQKIELQKWALRGRKRSIGNVTASFGVAEFKAGDKKKGLILRADKNLYFAKNSGRNRVVG
jgi:diguanylate cyclase